MFGGGLVNGNLFNRRFICVFAKVRINFWSIVVFTLIIIFTYTESDHQQSVRSHIAPAIISSGDPLGYSSELGKKLFKENKGVCLKDWQLWNLEKKVQLRALVYGALSKNLNSRRSEDVQLQIMFFYQFNE